MKKGFTLVELLAVIVILSMLIVVAGLGVSKLVKETKKDLTNTQKRAIISAAEIWSASNIESIPAQGCTAVSINELINSGAIDELQMNSFNNVDRDLTVVKICISSSDSSANYELVDIASTLSCFDVENVTGGVTITDYSSTCSKDVIIPTRINNKSVIGIDYEAFKNKSLTSVVISSTIVSIGNYAFRGNSLINADFRNASNLESIGNGAFGENYLTSVIIPDSVSTIGSNAFNYNNLKTVIIGSGISSIDGNAFANHTNNGYGPNNLETVIIYTAQSSNFTSNYQFDGFTGTIQFVG